MAENKTKKTDMSVKAFLSQVGDAQRLKDVTGEEPKMWGDSIVGFGEYRYTYESGRSGDWFLVGFSPRKQNLVLYLIAGIHRFPSLLEKLGKYKTGQSCLYLKGLRDIDLDILGQLIRQSYDYLKNAPSGQ